MTQNKELETAKRRIRALAEKTIENGATEAEAMMAMRKVGELLEAFNLTMDEVTIRQEVCLTMTFDTESKHLGAVGNTCVAIAKFTSTKVWMNRGSKSIVLSFFGLESDVEMAIYLCNLVNKTYVTEYDKFKVSPIYVNYTGGHRRILNTNFMNGFTTRLSFNMNELKAEMLKREKETAAYHREQMKERMLGESDTAKAEYAKMTTGTALVSMEKSKYIEEEFNKMGMKLRKGTKRYTSSRYNDSAFGAGRESGNKVNFNRPVGGSTNNTSGYLS